MAGEALAGSLTWTLMDVRYFVSLKGHEMDNFYVRRSLRALVKAMNSALRGDWKVSMEDDAESIVRGVELRIMNPNDFTTSYM